MATYNGGSFIGEQLESLARQSQLPHELVVCDDGSSDDTLAVVERFAAQAPFPVRTHRNELRLEYPNNFLKAASLCGGELIAFCDQDDVWLEAKLARCAQAFADPNVRLAIHTSEVTDERLVPIGTRFPRIPRSRVLPGLRTDPWWVPAGFCLVFSAQMFHSAYYRERPLTHLHDLGHQMPHDQWAYFLARGFGRIAFIAEPLALYRQHSSNASGFQSKGATWKLQAAVGANSSQYRRLSELADGYSSYFGTFKTIGSPSTDPPQQAVAYYRKLSKSYKLRADHYTLRPGPAKLARMVAMVLHGVYESKPRGGLGVKALVKDTILSLLR